MDLLPSQSVPIDGLSVRKIREEKRLTQLYVAKVVGVTTDTVSRWENNRYPTIKRDNALKLAEALEVDLDEILKNESEEQPEEEGSDPANKPFETKKLAIIGGIVLALVVVVILMMRSQPPVQPMLTVKRFVPAYAAPGSQILIRVEINSEKKLKGMILKESFPEGWQLIESIPVASSVDDQSSGARWIFRSPEQQIHLYYIVQVAENLDQDSDLQLQGEVIANPDGQRSAVTIENIGTMKIEPLHWADKNGNSIIDDLEILEVSNMTEETGTLNLGWDELEILWQADQYRWHQEEKRFVPVSSQE